MIDKAIAQAKTGDVICVRNTGLFSKATIKVLSGGRRPCIHSHDGVVYGSKQKYSVLNIAPLWSSSDPIRKYLTKIEHRGGAWAICRLKAVDGYDTKTRTDMILSKNWIRLRCSRNKGKWYPFKDIYILAKRVTGLDKHLKWIKHERKNYHCTHFWKHIWWDNPYVSVQPRDLHHQLPAPIHTEHVMERGEMVLIAESHKGFYDAMLTGNILECPQLVA